MRHFVETPIYKLDPDAVPAFLAVDEKSLPGRLRLPYLAKKEELLALKKVSDGRKKPPVRRLGLEDAPPRCAEPADKPLLAQALGLAGYVEIDESEERRLMRDTRCSECELEFEFTLMRTMEKPRGKPSERRPTVRYFLHEKDPLWALVAAYRQGGSAFGTGFFGLGHPSCH